jgi:guanylate kinase
VRPFPIILSAPSGGGKTTIARELLRQRDDVGYSVSCTTRSPRAGEVEGRDYYFLSVPEFQRRRDEGAFAEFAEVHGNLYGTLRSEVDRVLNQGRHVVMDIDVQGAKQFLRAYPVSVTVFVLPPSADVLLTRLRARQTESVAEVVDRLHSALAEFQTIEDYEYVVVNDDLNQAIKRVSAIIDAEVVSRERVEGLKHQIERLIADLEAEIHHHSS